MLYDAFFLHTRAHSRRYGVKGHNIFYEGIEGGPYGTVSKDLTATIPSIFRQGDSHKLRIHAHNCVELALKKWGSKGNYRAMNAEHKIRSVWRGGIKFHSFLSESASGWTLTWSRFRITPAIDYIKHFVLLDFDLPEISSDKVARAFFVSLCKFYNLLFLPNWTTAHRFVICVMCVLRVVGAW
jgi:hypothetical protein